MTKQDQEREPITGDMIATWKINYGLDKMSPADAMKWWDAKYKGMAPAGAVAALGLLLQEREALAQQSQALSYMEVRKDAAYLERNQCVAGMAHLARMLGLKAGVAKTAIEGWSEDWHGCLYIDLPTGQVSWHFHDSQAHLFAGLQAYGGSWDGHDTPEKYRRVSALAQQAEPPELSPELAQKPLEQQAEPMRVPEGFALVPVEPTAGSEGPRQA